MIAGLAAVLVACTRAAATAWAACGTANISTPAARATAPKERTDLGNRVMMNLVSPSQLNLWNLTFLLESANPATNAKPASQKEAGSGVIVKEPSGTEMSSAQFPVSLLQSLAS